MINNIVIAGAGVFGTALAQRLSWNNHNSITMYSIEPEVVEDINKNHQNSKYFPGRHLHNEITSTGDISCAYEADVIFLAIPSSQIKTYTQSIFASTQKNTLVVNLSKGFSDDGTFLTSSIPFTRLIALKGPTFAVELMNGVPSAMTVGGEYLLYNEIKGVFTDTGITLDHTLDINGVELMSVLKNMYAIAIGIVSGRYNSANVDFLILTRAVNEMRALVQLFGCNSETIFNYCGIGDLGLTSLTDLSRNRTLGLLIGKGFSNDPMSSTVIEGLRTIKLVGELVKEKHIENRFILLDSLYKLVYGEYSLNDYIVAVVS
ncbi:MAG: NAD(P)-binding domain-containing protein [Bacteroidales bacterium]|jgi:glycerol-3-phosphate dehydrogenase (NAD(P)+)|nr:NAD(P)-binding domain-containing protein [Bacteroidales bacterium]